MSRRKKTILQKLVHKYRLELFDESTFSAVLSFRISRLNVLMLTSLFSIILIVGVFLLVIFTPIKTFIPGYPTEKTRYLMERNSLIADSLMKELELKNQFFKGIRNIISGDDFKNNRYGKKDSLSTIDTKKIVFSRSSTDSLFRAKHESIEKYTLGVLRNKRISDLSNIVFYAPIKGIVTTKFNVREKHFGVDVSGKENARISAVWEGTVIFTGWTLETGYVLQIQHRNNLVSIYKHNSELLKKVGEYVKTGEAIALLGNSGELSSGPHLHFEIWHEGKVLNPQEYINF